MIEKLIQITNFIKHVLETNYNTFNIYIYRFRNITQKIICINYI